MNKPKSSVISEQASEWVAKMHDAELTESQHAEFKAWMAQSEEHRHIMRKMARRWEELNVLTLLAVPTEHVGSTKPSANTYADRSFRHGKFGIGMATAAAFLLALMLFIWPNEHIEPGTSPSLLSFSTKIGEQRTITLPDDSTVLLNTNSQFNIAYTDKYRDIYLVQGEAFFEVTKDVEHPFRVFAGKSKVRAVGTAFSVYLKKKMVDVTVTHGRVAIESINNPVTSVNSNSFAQNDQPTFVDAGQAAEFNQITEKIDTHTLADDAKIPAWQQGLMIFSGEPLELIIEEIARYDPLSIVILDSELRDLRIGGRFKIGDTRKVLEALEAGFGIKVEYINDNLVHLSAASS